MRPGAARRRAATTLALLLVVAGVAGCASVPSSSSVQILRRVTEGDTAVLPPGPVDGSDAGGLVRGFVGASGSSVDRHGAARRFLAEEAAGWNDSASVTVIDTQFDTVPAPDAGALGPDTTRYRIRGTAIGRMTASGAFEPGRVPVQTDVTLVRRDGQWRIAALPDGVLVPLAAFRDNYRAVRTWFVDPVRQLLVPDLRYLPRYPTRAQAARALELLLAGPSAALQGAVETRLRPGAQLRSNVALSPDGALIVDLTGLGELDAPSRQVLAAQVLQSLAEVNVARVQLLADGVPLLPDRPQLTRDDIAGLGAENPIATDAPGLIASDGRLRGIAGTAASGEVPGPVGNGGYDVESGATTVDGQRLAVVARTAGRRVLLVGGSADGGVSEVGLTAGAMTRPSWTGTEVWTVLDGSVVVRALLDPVGPVRIGQVDAAELTALGPVTALRLSRDGMRVAAVVAGGLWVGAVARGIDGGVAIRNLEQLGPADLGRVVDADWRAPESVVAVTQGVSMLVVEVSVDGLSVRQVPSNNLTPPLSAVAAAPGRPTLVTDQTGVWGFGGGEQNAWGQVLGGAADAVPFYPG